MATVTTVVVSTVLNAAYAILIVGMAILAVLLLGIAAVHHLFKRLGLY